MSGQNITVTITRRTIRRGVAAVAVVLAGAGVLSQLPEGAAVAGTGPAQHTVQLPAPISLTEATSVEVQELVDSLEGDLASAEEFTSADDPLVAAASAALEALRTASTEETARAALLDAQEPAENLSTALEQAQREAAEREEARRQAEAERRAAEEERRAAEEEAARQAAAEEVRKKAETEAADEEQARQEAATSRKPAAPKRQSVSGDYWQRAAGYLAQVGCADVRVVPVHEASAKVQREMRGGNAGAYLSDPTAVYLRGGLKSADHVRSLMYHECAHIKQGRAYGGDFQAAYDAMNRVYGTSGNLGVERNAECVARQVWGAPVASNHTHYRTDCRATQARIDTMNAIAEGRRP